MRKIYLLTWTSVVFTFIHHISFAQNTRIIHLSSPDLELSITGEDPEFTYEWNTVLEESNLARLDLMIIGKGHKQLPPLTVTWKIPAIDVKGTWFPNAHYNKSIRPNWASDMVQSRAAVDAPVVSLFTHEDSNLHTFAVSEALHTVRLHAGISEEESAMHCSVKLFSEPQGAIKAYSTSIRFDSRAVDYEQALSEVAKWWSTFDHLKPLEVPEVALLPMYSTWYSYHQSLELDKLLEECRLAYQIGYRAIIIDDGWQTNDNNRGYAFAGDWRPDRIPKMKEFVAQVHETGMKLLLWYSVPLVGAKSQAYERFKGKFLSENQGWGAAVLDPRYPQVRTYLIDTYLNALRDWGLDGFKLDFIDQFKAYEDTEFTLSGGRDYASVNQAVDRLMSDIVTSLKEERSDILIEFRQRYIGPSMRKYGNMFRAGDCPNDAVTNKIRTTDVRLISGNTAVHSDMLMWNYNEPVEVAAQQFLNIIFSVPQLSVRLKDIPSDHQKMISFYTSYWIENRETLMKGTFRAKNPAGNYTVLSASSKDVVIKAVYEENILTLDETKTTHIINAKLSSDIVLRCNQDIKVEMEVRNCLGQVLVSHEVQLKRNFNQLKVPPGGIVFLKRL